MAINYRLDFYNENGKQKSCYVLGNNDYCKGVHEAVKKHFPEVSIEGEFATEITEECLNEIFKAVDDFCKSYMENGVLTIKFDTNCWKMSDKDCLGSYMEFELHNRYELQSWCLLLALKEMKEYIEVKDMTGINFAPQFKFKDGVKVTFRYR